MKEILEIKKPARKTIPINPEVKKYEYDDFASRKLQQANEFLAKYGFPEEAANKRAEKGQKLNFWTTGIVIQANAKENVFSLTVKAPDKLSENTYIISTTSEILKKIVKENWGENIKVFLRPKAIIGQPFHYDLIEIE